MKWKIFAIKDVAIAAFNRPFFVRHAGEAIRSFGDEVNRSDQQNPLYGHPKDYELWCLGEFDDEVGVFTGSDISRIAAGVDVRNVES